MRLSLTRILLDKGLFSTGAEIRRLLPCMLLNGKPLVLESSEQNPNSWDTFLEEGSKGQFTLSLKSGKTVVTFNI